MTTVEHGTKLDAEAVHMMLERGTYLVPTLAIGNAFHTGDPGLPAHALAKDAASAEQHYRSVRMAAEAKGDLVLTGATVRLLENVNQSVSATAIREAVAAKRPLGKYVDPAVADYIKKVGLYGSK